MVIKGQTMKPEVFIFEGTVDNFRNIMDRINEREYMGWKLKEYTPDGAAPGTGIWSAYLAGFKGSNPGGGTITVAEEGFNRGCEEVKS